MQTTLEILNHPLLSDVRHGFFTRKGGASSGLFAGLNCGRRSSEIAFIPDGKNPSLATPPSEHCRGMFSSPDTEK